MTLSNALKSRRLPVASKAYGSSVMRRDTHNQGPSQRQLRVGELIRATLAELFAHGHFHAPSLAKTPLTVTEVRVTPDLKQAIAFIMPLGGQNKGEILEELKEIRKSLRSEVAKRIQLRYAPDLEFRLDDSFQRAAEVDALLRKPAVARDLKKNADPEDSNNAS